MSKAENEAIAFVVQIQQHILWKDNTTNGSETKYITHSHNVSTELQRLEDDQFEASQSYTVRLC